MVFSKRGDLHTKLLSLSSFDHADGHVLTLPLQEKIIGTQSASNVYYQAGAQSKMN